MAMWLAVLQCLFVVNLGHILTRSLLQSHKIWGFVFIAAWNIYHSCHLDFAEKLFNTHPIHLFLKRNNFSVVYMAEALGFFVDFLQCLLDRDAIIWAYWNIFATYFKHISPWLCKNNWRFSISQKSQFMRLWSHVQVAVWNKHLIGLLSPLGVN